MEIKTFREIHFDKADDIINDVRLVFPAKMISNYGGVFYNDGSEHDFHNKAIRIKSLRDFMLGTGLIRFWHNTAIIASLQGVMLHSDWDSRFSYSLLFPIWNTEGTYTEFYDTDAPYNLTITDHGDHKIHYNTFEEGNHKFIDKVELKLPTIVNTDTPHKVVQPENSGVRVSLSLRLHGEKQDVESVLSEIFHE